MPDDYYQKGKSVLDKNYDYRKERTGEGGNTTEADIIVGASRGLGFLLTALLFTKDTRTEEEKKEDDDKWKKSGCRKGCIWIVIAVIAFAILGHLA